jgi:type IX secretion system PorP/SprF family membrane protein
VRKKIYISLLCLLFAISESPAQNSPIYSQYMFNNFLINPACAGAEGYTAIDLTARENWLRIPDAPRTYGVSFQTRLIKGGGSSSHKRYTSKNKGRVGIGGTIYSDKLANYSQTGGSFTYAYHMYLQKTQISMGLSLGGYQYMLDKSQVITENPDRLLNGSNMKAYVPDANLGVAALYMGGYAGFSVSDLIGGSIRFGDVNDVSFKKYRTYNLIGYYLFELPNNFAIEPGMWLKMQEKTWGFNYTATMRVYYGEEYWGGLSYRTSDKALIFMAGIRYDRYFFGYAFDYSMIQFTRSTFGSHEFMFAAKFGDNVRRYRWVSRY